MIDCLKGRKRHYFGQNRPPKFEQEGMGIPPRNTCVWCGKPKIRLDANGHWIGKGEPLKGIVRIKEVMKLLKNGGELLHDVSPFGTHYFIYPPKVKGKKRKGGMVHGNTFRTIRKKGLLKLSRQKKVDYPNIPGTIAVFMDYYKLKENVGVPAKEKTK